MELDKIDLIKGLRFLCGTWQVEYIVNGFSDNLDHIPASEFRSKDGSDFSCITYTFFEDHTMVMNDTSSGREEKGTWEQVDFGEFHYTLNGFVELPEGAFKENAEKLSVSGSNIVFSIGFLGIGMKKTADGVVTEEVDIADVQPSEEDNKEFAIVGKYIPEKVMTVVNNKFGFFTKDEAKPFFDEQLSKDVISKRDYEESMRLFDMYLEITSEHKIVSWMKLPESVTEEMIKQAVEAGQISEVRDGYFTMEYYEWKCVDGKYYYDTKTRREISGEHVSSWDEFKEDKDGYLPFASGMMKLKKV